MEDLGYYIEVILLLLFFAVAIVFFVRAKYLRHLEKVANGEIRGAHSRIPEPRQVADLVFKGILLVLVIVLFINSFIQRGKLEEMNVKLDEMNKAVSHLESEQEVSTRYLSMISDDISRSNCIVANTVCEIKDVDYESKKANVYYLVTLKEKPDDAEIIIRLDDIETKMTKKTAMTYEAIIPVGIFDEYYEAELCVKLGDDIVETEGLTAPGSILASVFPLMESYASYGFSYDEENDRYQLHGSNDVTIYNKDSVSSVITNYYSKDTLILHEDITKEVLAGTQKAIEGEVYCENALKTEIIITMKNDYKVIYNGVIYPHGSEEYLTQILDPEGNVIWSEDRR